MDATDSSPTKSSLAEAEGVASLTVPFMNPTFPQKTFEWTHDPVPVPPQSSSQQATQLQTPINKHTKIAPTPSEENILHHQNRDAEPTGAAAPASPSEQTVAKPSTPTAYQQATANLDEVAETTGLKALPESLAEGTSTAVEATTAKTKETAARAAEAASTQATNLAALVREKVAQLAMKSKDFIAQQAQQTYVIVLNTAQRWVEAAKTQAAQLVQSTKESTRRAGAATVIAAEHGVERGRNTALWLSAATVSSAKGTASQVLAVTGDKLQTLGGALKNTAPAAPSTTAALMGEARGEEQQQQGGGGGGSSQHQETE